MLFFSRKHELLKTPLFEGFKDYHSHILPAVDDGVKSLDESLTVLEYFEQLKVAEVILTPHVMAGINEGSNDVLSTYQTICEAYKGDIKLSLASEYMLDTNFPARFAEGARMLEGNSILVETSYFSAPNNVDELLFEVCCSGCKPVIAHPERYLYMENKDYHKLQEKDYAFQLNLLSFSDIYGPQVTKNTMYLLEQGLYNVIGTDLHRLSTFKSRISQIKLSTKNIDRLLELKGNRLL
ncbi:MAG: CpsB/CapC family capsule biosynthesis tyrosine phosphatase [Rikenellaceae bacterium]